VFGLPWQIAVSLLGILVVVITVTGVLIWWRKRRPRRSHVRERTQELTFGEKQA
jgi:uncharacterized iron-regulated membrane protein